MFSNIVIFSLASSSPLLDSPTDESLAANAFAPCGPTQEQSSGWVPPRGEEHGALVETVAGQVIMKLQVETRKVPADAIDRAVQVRITQIEAATGRKPGKKEIRDLKDEARLSLMPHAFSKLSAHLVWIDREASRLVIEASSQSHADLVASALVQSIEGLVVSLVNTKTAPGVAMANWLLEQVPPDGFSVDRACELKASDESKAVVRYNNHRLDIDEVVDHVIAGKLPTKLAMTWTDRASFILTEGMQVKKLAFLDVVTNESSHGKNDGFDADMAIATGELRKMIPDLLGALDGVVEVEVDEEVAA